MQSNDLENVVGAALIPGFIGASLALSYAKEITRKQAMAAVALGVSVAVYGTPLVIHWMPESWKTAPLERGFAFFLGLFAMPLVPVLQSVIVSNVSKFRASWNKE